MTGKKTAKKTKRSSVVANPSEASKRSLKEIGGSPSDDWNNVLANQTIHALWLTNSDPEKVKRQRNGTIAALVGIGPKDELEGMMAAQLIAAHNAAMECYRRAMIPEQSFEGRRENLSQANKLSRTYATLLEALDRHRGKGQQKVTVEHVHVYQGGQAVVGVVTPGGGDRQSVEEQPHAKEIDYAPKPTVWSADKTREPMQIAGDDERPMPDARRNVAGRATGK
jgi:hypothetical protein